MKSSRTRKGIITCAITGNIHTPSMSLHLPVTPDQITAAAIRESHQIGTLQPTTLVSYDTDIAPIFDAGEVQALVRYDVTPEDLAADDWRLRMSAEGRAPTQIFAEHLISALSFSSTRTCSIEV